MRDKVIYSSPNFDPKVFLSWVHKDTSAADLEAGALTLKTDLKGRTQQKKQLVKENFDYFVSCKTTIDDIESKLRQIEEDPEGATIRCYGCCSPLLHVNYVLNTILSLNMAIAFLVALVLDNTVPGGRQERGLYVWSEAEAAMREPTFMKDYELPFKIGRPFRWVKCVGL
ncbi:Exocyst complex component SEC5A [Zea mays]|uniref:Exocyst complex component SEC5 n=1 Tax=Zea mays TaxID=4577 RepID=A0A1D6MLY0_MAIZE|nr:Exocyst complex component SEC5A [Zea mays]